MSQQYPKLDRLGLVVDHVIQAIGRPDFEDGLKTGSTVEVITDIQSFRTNPEVSVRPTTRCGRFAAVHRGHKTHILQLGSVPV